MSRLDGLRLVAKPARCSNTPIHKRRANVMRALDEQIRLAERLQAGERYTPTVPRWEIDPATGERWRIEWPRRVYAWFWQVDGAEWFVTLRYGNRCIDLARGRRAVQVESLAEVIETLRTLREAAREGEFDAGLESASRTIHARFKA
jgi:hypothetical protein